MVVGRAQLRFYPKDIEKKLANFPGCNEDMLKQAKDSMTRMQLESDIKSANNFVKFRCDPTNKGYLCPEVK